jgi:hypothetical protein
LIVPDPPAAALHDNATLAPAGAPEGVVAIVGALSNIAEKLMLV